MLVLKSMFLKYPNMSARGFQTSQEEKRSTYCDVEEVDLTHRSSRNYSFIYTHGKKLRNTSSPIFKFFKFQ